MTGSEPLHRERSAEVKGKALDDSNPRGPGPGAIAPDGSPTDLYAVLPPDDESAALLHTAVPAGASILELGAGTGRMTHLLAALGHPVVAVDESAEMLAHVRGVETVRCRIEDLDLDRRFDVVLLASHVLEYVGVDVEAMLSVCRRHVAPGGRVIFQRQPSQWYDTVRPGTWTRKGVHFELCDLRRPAPGVVSATMRYRIGSRTWSHSFTSRRIGDDVLPALLARAGLHFERFISPDGGWVLAGPVG
jgi:SAM-dependent methyltransferase